MVGRDKVRPRSLSGFDSARHLSAVALCRGSVEWFRILKGH